MFDRHTLNSAILTLAPAQAQKQALGLRYPSAPAWAYRLIDAEVAGQAEYFAAHGRFPGDQEQFTLEAADGKQH